MHDHFKIIKELEANLGLLSDEANGKKSSNRGFAKSLVSQFKTKGEKLESLSDKQWYWVDKLWSLACGIDGADGNTELQVEPKQADKEDAAIIVGSFDALDKMFKSAVSPKLKYPSVTVKLVGDTVMLLKLYPSTKFPGSIMIRSAGAYAVSDSYGWVKDGKFNPRWGFKNLSLGDQGMVVTLLTVLSKDPQNALKANGLLTGRCCFCNSNLDDEKSTAMGYGPVCAKRWGLEWGTVKADPSKMVCVEVPKVAPQPTKTEPRQSNLLDALADALGQK